MANQERYKELKEIIESEQYEKIGKYRDFPIIANSDLSELLVKNI